MEKELRKLRRDLVEIEKDCLELEKKGNLTEYGKGELHIIRLLKDNLCIYKKRKTKTLLYNML